MQKSGGLRSRATGLPQKVDLEYASLQIQKLRTLRFDQEKAQATSDDAYLLKLRDMFVSEVTPQLLFCDAAIRNMANPQERAFELGYLFRVMQTVGDVAEAIGAANIVELARACEHFYTSLRVTTKNVTDLMMEIASDANSALRDAVNSMDHSGDGTSDSKNVILALRQASDALDSMENRPVKTA
jgi:chemotaxis protein histidine kinase CheA